MGSELVDGGDVRMVETARRLRLLLEAAQPVGIAREDRRKHLDRDVALQPRVARPVDLPHPARADRREDLVGAELCPCGERQVGGILTVSRFKPARTGVTYSAQRFPLGGVGSARRLVMRGAPW